MQPESNKSYELVTTAMTWSNAKAYAESQAGYLMEINSSEEQDYIEEFLEDLLTNMSYTDYNSLIMSTIAQDGGASAYLWLGGSDSEDEGGLALMQAIANSFGRVVKMVQLLMDHLTYGVPLRSKMNQIITVALRMP